MSAARRLHRRPGRSALAGATALATVVAYAGLSTLPGSGRASADPGVAEIRAFLTQLGSQTVPSLAGVGALGQTLKTLDLAPAGDKGLALATLLSKAKTDVLDATTSWASATTLSGLADEIDGADHALNEATDARTVKFTASSTAPDSAGVQTLTVNIEAHRTSNGVGFNVASASPEFSMASGDGLRATLELKASFTVANAPSTGATWLVAAGPKAPSLTVSVDTSVPNPGAVHAGVGILGIKLADDSSFRLQASVSTAWSDPNGDGRLAFLEAGGVPGELAAAGSGPGLISASLGAASVHANLHLQPRDPGSSSLSLPATLDATVHIDSDNLATTEPVVTLDSPTALDGIKDFLTLSPRDLAQGIAQAASAIVALQQRTGVALPFMSGNTTDAVTAVESIVKFLQDNVSPATSPEKPGNPKFGSIQDLLDKLHTATGLPTGTSLDVGSASYNQALRKLYFTITASRVSGHSRPLDAAAPALTGSGSGVTYGDTSLTDSAANFDPVVDGRHDFRDALIGRTVTVGDATAAIKSVISPTQLELDPHAAAPEGGPDPASAWRGGTPAAGAPYVIQADDPKTGLVQLGNVLSGGGIANANAKTPQATFDPSYTLTIPLALDLRPKDTEHCDPAHPDAVVACPFSYADPVSGITSIITALPLAPDRVLIKGNTDLLTADAPISTHVDVDATVGFFALKLTGDLRMCTQGLDADCDGGSTSQHLATLHLNSLSGADPQGYVPIAKVFDQLRTAPASVFSGGIHGQAFAHLAVSVPGAADFFPSGTDVHIDVTMPDITDPTNVDIDQNVFSLISGLNFDTSNPQALLTQLIAILRGIQAQTGALSSVPGFDTKLPLVGSSLNDLLSAPYRTDGEGTQFANVAEHGTLVDPAAGVGESWIGRSVTVGSQSLSVVRVDGSTLVLDQPWAPVPAAGSAFTASTELDGLINDLSSNTPTSLQDLIDRFAPRLGAGSGASFKYIAQSGSEPQKLQLTFDWKRSAATSVPLGLHFDLGDLVGAQGDGLLALTASGEIKLKLTFPLTTAAVADPLGSLVVDQDDSFIRASVSANGDGASYDATLGPFTVQLGSSATELRAGLGVKLDSSGTGDDTLGNFVSSLALSVDQNAAGVSCPNASSGSDDIPLVLCAYIPATVNGAPSGTAGHDAFKLRIPLGTDLGSMFNLGDYVVAGDNTTPARFEAPDGLADAFANAVLNLLSFQDGILGYLHFLENAFRTASFDGKLPLIGHDLQAGADFIGQVNTAITSAFSSAPDASDPAANDSDAVKAFLDGPIKSALPVLPGVTYETHVYCGVGVECASQGAADITGFSITTDIGQGDVSACPSDDTKCAVSANVPIDLGLPGLSVKSTDEGGVGGGLAWRVHLTLGLDRNAGFFVLTQDDGQPEVKVAANLHVGNAALRLAFINVGLERLHPETPEFSGTFSIDLKNPADGDCLGGCGADTTKKLTMADLTSASLSDVAKVQLTAAAVIDWRLRADVSAALPGIGADFHLHWDWASSDPSAHTPSGGHGLTELGFDNIQLNPGQFLNGAIGPIVRQIASVYKPIKPILDTIQAPIPVLSDLSRAVGGDDVTIESLARAFSTVAGGPESLDAFFRVVGIIKSVGDALSSISSSSAECPGDGFCIDLGAIDLKPDQALTVKNSPDSAGSSYTVDGSGPPTDLKQQVQDKGHFNLDSAHDTANPSYGFSFPVLENPASLFGIIVGQDVDLVNFDSGPLTIGFEFSQKFGPVYAPPPVMVVISGGASVSLHIVAGFDTYGIRTAVEQGKPAQILNGLFFRTTDAQGKPIPVVHFEGFLAAGASVSAVVIEVGIVGGIKLTVDFTWNDPNNDGKFRFGEFLSAAINNPICLFNVGGELSLFIKVFITLGISPFSVSFDFELVNIKLLDFSLKPNCTPPPPKLAGQDGKTLYLYAGKFGRQAQRGHEVWDNKGTADETWVIRQVPPRDGKPGEIVVQALGITESFDDGVNGDKIDEVVLDGRGYGGKLTVTLAGGTKGQLFTKRSVIYTGSKDDVIRSGSGASVIDAGGGNDQITTTDRPDLSKTVASQPAAVVAGGPGNDVITTGNAADWVEGDGELAQDQRDATTKDSANHTVALNGVINPPALGHKAESALTFSPGGDDSISVGLGGSTVYGGDGKDTIGTANDNPQAGLSEIANDTNKKSLYVAQPSTIVGGAGGDRIKGGSASDFIYTGAKVATGKDALGSGDADDDQNTVDTGTGSDTVYGSNGIDYVTTHSLATTSPVQQATVYGGGANDVLIGGAGTDKLYGGPGNDYVIAEPATVSGDTPLTDLLGAARSVQHLPLSTPSSTKTLVGGGGKDRIYGGDGAALIYGDRDVDQCALQSDPISKQPAETGQPSGLSAQEYDDKDLVYGGAGIDTVYAGGGADHVFAAGSPDFICGGADDDDLHAGAGDDTVYGGSGVDRVYGEAGLDRIFGNDGDDQLFGQEDADLLEGNDGTDTVHGGVADDVIIGGSSKAGLADAGDYLYGDDGADILVGDDASGTTRSTYPTDLTGTPATAGGIDRVFGGFGDDRAYGGLAGDYVYGGPGADHLEGNTAHDYVYGESGADDIIGGSSLASGGSGVATVGYADTGDTLSGGANDDVIAGDNAVVEKVDPGMGSTLTKGRGLTSERAIQLLDLGYVRDSTLYGDDDITAGDGNDLVFGQSGVETIHGDLGDDYLEGGQDGDTLDGDDGQDDLVGGSYADQSTRQGQLDAGDTIRGGNDGDVALGDNGLVTRDPSAAFSDLVAGRGINGRSITLFDVGDTPTPGTSGPDWIQGQQGVDVLLGQGASDRVQGGSESDYVEGGPAADWLEGNAGSDDAVGGSSEVRLGTGDDASGQLDGADVIWGGSGDDVVAGDNARVTRVEPYNDLTNRIGTLVPGTLAERRSIRLLDLRNGGSYLAAPSAPRFGADRVSGQEGNDVLLGQDGDDALSGGSNDDYVEGQGGAEKIYGDMSLADAGVTVTDPTSVGVATLGYSADGGTAGQDDLMGGSSGAGFRDVADEIRGNAGADFILGDNGNVSRYVDGAPGSLVDRINTGRYPSTLPAGAAKLRHAAAPEKSTRFCTTEQDTCEPTGAFGADRLYGDAGDDVMYGQDGDDQMWGAEGDDDMFGELGADRLFGEAGNDAILGDRGGLVDVYQSGSNAFAVDNNQVPKIHYDGFVAGTVTRKVDLLHDNDGAAFVGSSTAAPMPHAGVGEGGDDWIRGGTGRDSVHAGYGDDLVNGDSGGDVIFGDQGADVLWGGRGIEDTAADPNTRGANDANVDYIFAGKGGVSDSSKRSVSGSDIIDWRPRGSYSSPGTPATCTDEQWPVDYIVGKKATATLDPCRWFQMTDIMGANTSLYQHHQGIDWIYGGWDRDVLQADVADNGPNDGDRLLDWNGAYNLYTHCNAAYGGFNDVRQHSPAHQDFLQKWAWSTGAGQGQSDAATEGTAAFDELALVYPGKDNDHGAGPAYPGTPGHFDEPNACGS